MKLNNISLPYPVLGLNDDVQPMLENGCVQFDDVYKENGKFVFKIKLKQENETITRLISVHKAKYTCEVDCSKTFFGECFDSDTECIEIKIPCNKLVGRVSFNCFVSVIDDFNYSNPDFNEDYQGYSFDMHLGDILVAFPSAHYDIDVNYDKLQAAGSFMQVMEGRQNSVTTFDISGDKIFIKLPTVLYDLYKQMENDTALAELFYSSIVMNALTHALNNIDRFESCLWARTIEDRLNMEESFRDLDIKDPMDIPEIAQLLLRDPYERLFKKLSEKKITIEEED